MTTTTTIVDALKRELPALARGYARSAWDGRPQPRDEKEKAAVEARQTLREAISLYLADVWAPILDSADASDDLPEDASDLVSVDTWTEGPWRIVVGGETREWPAAWDGSLSRDLVLRLRAAAALPGDMGHISITESPVTDALARVLRRYVRQAKALQGVSR